MLYSAQNWRKSRYPEMAYEFLRLHPEAAKTLYVVVLDKERISADDVCTIFNAVMNTASEKVINAMMSEDEKLTRECIEVLQRAGY